MHKNIPNLLLTLLSMTSQITKIKNMIQWFFIKMFYAMWCFPFMSKLYFHIALLNSVHSCQILLIKLPHHSKLKIIHYFYACTTHLQWPAFWLPTNMMQHSADTYRLHCHHISWWSWNKWYSDMCIIAISWGLIPVYRDKSQLLRRYITTFENVLTSRAMF